jgi:hypothetical protein
MRRFVPYLPAESSIKNKPLFGTMGQEKRWSTYKKITPGVGDYNLNGFKSLSRACETVFETIKHESCRSSTNEQRRHLRSRSVLERTGMD